MRGIVYDGTKAELINDLEVRAPGPREVVVAVQAAGLCHSDVSYMSGIYPVPHPGVCGHEGAGIVQEVGSAVTHVVPGDHVVISTLFSCGACRQCADGHPTMCRKSIGNATQPFSRNGEKLWNFAATSAFAEHTLVGDMQCVKIDKDIPWKAAAVVGCGVVTGMGAVFNRSNVKRGQRAMVIGVGGVGLNTIQALKVQGASTIIAVDTVPEKEEIARKFGATHFLDGKREDLIQAVVELCPPDNGLTDRGFFNAGGVDWAYDVVAHPSVTETALECLDWGGNVVVLGVPGQDARFTGRYVRLTQIDRGIIGCRAGSYAPHRDIPYILDLYKSGQVLLDELVTNTFPIEQWEDAVHVMEGGKAARSVVTF